MDNNKETYVAGHYERLSGYSYFVPNTVNQEWFFTDNSLLRLLEQASQSLGELNAFARFVPNIDLFIHMHVTKESVVSSRIEGTQTNMEQALMPEEAIAPEQRNDWREVTNYTKAMNHSIAELDNLPLSSRLIRNAHEVLMQGARGENKQPGEFRKSQNWIGGATLQNAVYIPPNHLLIGELLSDLENFMHNETIGTPFLIRAAIAHYQFESIHPFLDGNGRIGRLLITLLLVTKKMLEKPLLYLSSYFEQNRAQYYDLLNRVRTHNEMEAWVKFFLLGVQQTAENAVAILKQILLLKEGKDMLIEGHFKKKLKVAKILNNHLFENPVVRIKDVQHICNLSAKTAGALVEEFVALGILTEHSGLQRNRVFVFEAYINLFGPDADTKELSTTYGIPLIAITEYKDEVTK